MIVLSALSLFAVLLYISVGILTYRLDRSKEINRLFLLWSMSMAIWSFGYAFVYITEEQQYIWMKISALGWCFFSVILLHLAMLFTGTPGIGKPLVKAAIYLPGFVFLYMSIFVFFPGRSLPRAVENFFYTGNFLYNFSCLLASLCIIFRWGLRSKSPIDRKQAKIIFVSSSIPFLLDLFIQNILPFWGISFIPLMGHIFTLIMLLGIYYAIRHYRLFDVSPQRLNDQIFAEMMDLAIVVSPDGQILKVSDSTGRLLGYEAGELLGKPVNRIIHDANVLSDILAERHTPVVIRYSETNCMTKDGEPLPFSISCSPLMDSRQEGVMGIVLVGHDIRTKKYLEQEIAERKSTEEQLRSSEARFKAMFYQNTAVMYLMDFDSLHIFDSNMAARKYYGYSEEEFKTIKITDLNGLQEKEMREILKEFEQKKNEVYHFKHRLVTGEWRDVEIHSTDISVRDRKMLFSIVTDITDRKKAQEYVSYLAYHDTLTGLPNRKCFYEKLHAEMERMKRKNEKAAVLFVDLDGFKAVNDNHGHEAGDLLLCEVASRMKAQIRESDMVARMGGDEFVLLILDIAGRRDAETVAEKIMKALGSPVMIGEKPVRVQASVGIGIYPDDGDDMDVLINRADNEMYSVKRDKNQIGKKNKAIQ